MNPSYDFHGQVALVTGAGSGTSAAEEPAEQFDRVNAVNRRGV